jgi:putative addiction module component (TIGR02574 family)
MSINDILRLSVAERLRILEKIWSSITTDEIQITTEQKKELDKRLERMKKGETKFFTWEQVKTNLRRK